MKKLSAILIALMSVPVMAWAQVPPAPPGPRRPAIAPAPAPAHHPPGRPDLGKWWKNSEIAKELQLSEAQVNQIEQAFLDHRLKLIDLRAEVERQETRLQPLVEADQPDEAKVSAQLDALLAARGKLEKQNVMMMLGIRRVLTIEQWKKLQAMQQHHEHMMAPRPPMLGPVQHGQPPQPGQPPRPPRPPEVEQP